MSARWLITSRTRSINGHEPRHFELNDSLVKPPSQPPPGGKGFEEEQEEKDSYRKSVSYTHLTLPTNREV